MRRGLALSLLIALLPSCGNGDTAPGPGPGPGPDAPTNLAYALAQGLYRVGEAIAPNPATVVGTVDTYTVAPPLPGGLTLDATTGEISGTPGTEAANTTHTVTATNAGGSTSTDIQIDVGPQLPTGFASLPLGFVAEEMHTGTAVKIGKLALAPDGRIFFAEVATGIVRTITPGTPPTVATWGNVTVLPDGGHQGLIGLALHPDFENNGWVYVQACVPGNGVTTQDRQEVYRFTDVNDAATNQQTIIPDLPISVSGAGGINCGGELLFDGTGMLLFSIGDVEDPSTAQADFPVWGGKIHRIDPGDPPGTAPSIPGDNPDAGSPEFVRGIRNCFGIALHGPSGGLFAVDNGPAADDELNLLQSGRNYEWMDAVVPPNELGPNIERYQDVITPTALCWHLGQGGWGTDYEDNLFMTCYTDHAIRRFEMSGLGPIPVDIDRETVWATFVDDADQHRPLDVCIDPTTGDMYVSTFTSVYRISKQ